MKWSGLLLLASCHSKLLSANEQISRRSNIACNPEWSKPRHRHEEIMAICKRGMPLLFVLHSVRMCSILPLLPRMVRSAPSIIGCERTGWWSLFNLHGEWYYCCCGWFTAQECSLWMRLLSSFWVLFVPERSDARSKISSVLVGSDSSEKGKVVIGEDNTFGNDCLRCG